MNKRKSVSCMSTSVTSLQVLEDVLEDLLADAGDQLEHHWATSCDCAYIGRRPRRGAEMTTTKEAAAVSGWLDQLQREGEIETWSYNADGGLTITTTKAWRRRKFFEAMIAFGYVYDPRGGAEMSLQEQPADDADGDRWADANPEEIWEG